MKVNYGWDHEKPEDLTTYNQTKQWHLNKRHMSKTNLSSRRAKLTALMGLRDQYTRDLPIDPEPEEVDMD